MIFKYPNKVLIYNIILTIYPTKKVSKDLLKNLVFFSVCVVYQFSGLMKDIRGLSYEAIRRSFCLDLIHIFNLYITFF